MLLVAWIYFEAYVQAVDAFTERWPVRHSWRFDLRRRSKVMVVRLAAIWPDTGRVLRCRALAFGVFQPVSEGARKQGILPALRGT